MMDDMPYILEESGDYAVVYKPHYMHSIGKIENDNNLYDWYKERSKNVFDIMHRLDYETQGLILFARNEKAYIFFRNLQDNGDFIKEYSAVCVRADEQQEQGFPPCPPVSSLLLSNFQTDKQLDKSFVIESYFRPFGPGRKQVRPVIEDGKKHKEAAKDKGEFYKTFVTGVSAVKSTDTGAVNDAKISSVFPINNYIFTVQIKRGFRHQIRCHLAWIGFPIKGDPLYSQPSKTCELLALRSHALFFTDPSSGQKRECRIDPLAKP